MTDSKSEYIYYNNQIFKVPVVAVSLDAHPKVSKSDSENKVPVVEWDYSKYEATATSSYLQNYKKHSITVDKQQDELRFKTPTKVPQSSNDSDFTRGRAAKKQEGSTRSRSAPSNKQRSKSVEKPASHVTQSPIYPRKRTIAQNTIKPSGTPKRTPSTPIFIKSSLAPREALMSSEPLFSNKKNSSVNSPYFTGTSLTSEQLLASIDASIYSQSQPLPREALNNKFHAEVATKSRRERREEILRNVESDEDLVDRIHRELDKVYQAVESGRTPASDVWNLPQKPDTSPTHSSRFRRSVVKRTPSVGAPMEEDRASTQSLDSKELVKLKKSLEAQEALMQRERERLREKEKQLKELEEKLLEKKRHETEVVPPLDDRRDEKREQQIKNRIREEMDRRLEEMRSALDGKKYGH